jgi:hypothetical protein
VALRRMIISWFLLNCRKSNITVFNKKTINLSSVASLPMWALILER